MKPVDERILEFITEHHVLTLAVTGSDGPWCASCFYVYLPEKNRFVFTSDPDTKHIREFVAGNDSRVAGTIALETKITGKIRGVQFAGPMKELYGRDLEEAKAAYLERFPIARLAKLFLWGAEPDIIKMTDNRLGFGKKLIWQK